VSGDLPAEVLPNRLLTDRELAAILGVKPSWIAESARQGQIPHVKLGRYRRFVLSDVLRWLEEQKTGGAARRKHLPRTPTPAAR
jgi:excisionase family DNA binding protein